MALKNNTWKLNQWYDQSVAGNVSYSGVQQLWVWGTASNGRLGQNDIVSQSSPIQIPGATWTSNYDFDSGCKMCFGIKTDGTLWAWGENQNGKLGLNESQTDQKSSPTQIPGTTWSFVAGGTDGGVATKTDGTLWVWGRNNYGRLGLNSTAYYSSPVQVPGTTWSKACNTDHYMFAIKTDGTLWGWGRGGEGRLAQNNLTSYSSPVQIPGTWTDVDAGNSRGGAVNTDGELWVWGYNANGDLGVNNRTHYSSPVQVPGSWSRISVRGEKMLGVKTDGTLWGWGNNAVGSLGQNFSSSPSNNWSSPVQIGSDTTWQHVSNSYTSVCAIKTDNTLWVWGDNGSGQLGLNNKTQYSSPVQVPGSHVYAEVWGNGANIASIQEF